MSIFDFKNSTGKQSYKKALARMANKENEKIAKNFVNTNKKGKLSDSDFSYQQDPTIMQAISSDVQYRERENMSAKDKVKSLGYGITPGVRLAGTEVVDIRSYKRDTEPVQKPKSSDSNLFGGTSSNKSDEELDFEDFFKSMNDFKKDLKDVKDPIPVPKQEEVKPSLETKPDKKEEDSLLDDNFFDVDKYLNDGFKALNGNPFDNNASNKLGADDVKKEQEKPKDSTSPKTNRIIRVVNVKKMETDKPVSAPIVSKPVENKKVESATTKKTAEKKPAAPQKKPQNTGFKIVINGNKKPQQPARKKKKVDVDLLNI